MDFDKHLESMRRRHVLHISDDEKYIILLKQSKISI